MEAIIKTGGKQYHVKKGQTLAVERLSAQPGSEVTFDVLALLGDKPEFGQPVVGGVKVVAKVLRHTKARKVTVRKYKRRKGYHKKQGHRQLVTQVAVKEIRNGA